MTVQPEPTYDERAGKLINVLAVLHSLQLTSFTLLPYAALSSCIASGSNSTAAAAALSATTCSMLTVWCFCAAQQHVTSDASIVTELHATVCCKQAQRASYHTSSSACR
jgi:hypothetical protein